MSLRSRLRALVLASALVRPALGQAEPAQLAPTEQQPNVLSVEPRHVGPRLPPKVRPRRTTVGPAPVDAAAASVQWAPVTPSPSVDDAPSAEDSVEEAGAWSSMGELALEGRAFAPDGDARTVDAAAAIFARLEERYVRGSFDQRLRVYGRADGLDRGRSTAVVEEALLQLSTPLLRLRAGVDLVNWTAMEAFHPADVLNARNLDGDIESLEKRGELMLALEFRPFEGTAVGAMLMPYRSTPLLPSPRSRLGFFPPGLDVSGPPRFIDRDGRATSGRWGLQMGLTLRQVVGAADISVHAIEHVDKLQPLLRADPDGQRAFLVFQTVRQIGGTYQHALGSLLAKAEVAHRSFVEPSGPLPGAPLGNPVTRSAAGQPSHLLAAAGLEYLVPHGASESTVYLEGQMLFGIDDERERSVLTPFQRDALVGYRWAANDEDDLQAMASAIVDLERPGELIFSLSHQRRLGETWSMQAGLRFFFAQRNAPGLVGTLRSGDHAYLTITRHF